MRYPAALSPDGPVTVANPFPRQLTVGFYTHGTTTGPIGVAPLLFATNGQINAIVPAAVGSTPVILDIIVSFGNAGATPSNLQKSASFPVNIAATDPGMFTIGSDGAGRPAAALNANYVLISSTSPAGMRAGGVSPATNSDWIQLYVTGLGIPTSVGNGLVSNAGCVAAVPGSGNLPGSYEALLHNYTGVTLTNIDGAVIQSGLLDPTGITGNLAPCFVTTLPTVAIGGVVMSYSATAANDNVNYAGFVADTVAGLYQINVKLPASSTTGLVTADQGTLSGPLTKPALLPITFSFGGVTSQTGVTVAVAPKLLITPLTYTSGTSVTVPIGDTYAGTLTAAGGSSTYTWALTSGVLPPGMLMSTGGVFSGAPAELSGGNYQVTVMATDTSSPPISDVVSFTFSVPAALNVTGSAIPAVFATGSTVYTASAGNNVYTYASPVTATGATPVSEVTLGAASGILATGVTTPAGTYPFTITATDANGETGSVTSAFVVNLLTAPASLTNTTVTTAGGIQAVTTVVVTGYSGTGGTPLTCVVNGVNSALFTCADSGGTITISTVSPTTMTIGTPYAFTVTVTDTATAPNALAGAPNYATGTTATITVTPAS